MASEREPTIRIHACSSTDVSPRADQPWCQLCGRDAEAVELNGLYCVDCQEELRHLPGSGREGEACDQNK